MEQGKQHKWIAIGKKYQPANTQDQQIEIPETGRSVSMDNGQDLYGEPIDAPLAIHFIRSLFQALNPATGEQNVGELASELLKGTFAITFDKNALMKTLSQPACEGIRFYLCMNEDADGRRVLSLVTVGVDKDGKDLNFDFQPGSYPVVPDIQTKSLLSEYGKTSPQYANKSDESLKPYVLFLYAINYE